jgi:ribosomal protein S18 acetylase RimI-like enzyme
LAGRFVVRYELSVRPADVGSRVSLRFRLPSGQLTDVVGRLESWEAGVLQVRRRDGTVAAVRADALVAGKVVPAGPTHLDASVRELEEIASLGWRALETSHLGGWLLRASGGWTGRANSVLPLGGPGLPLGEAVERVEEWYEARGLPARFQVPMPLCGELDGYLASHGWSTPEDVLVMTADIGRVLPQLEVRDDLPPVVLADRPDAGWLSTYRYRGGPLPEIAVAVLTNAERPVFASVERDGATVAVGRASLDRGWLGVTAVDVAEAVRRQGLARHVMRALLAHGRAHGARHVYLQVSEHNAAALALYEGMGLSEHHRYRYRLPPPLPR